jgi:hypothetical protein
MEKNTKLFQLRFSSKTRQPLFPDETHRRRAIHRLAEVMTGRLVCFGFVDDHGHIVAFDTEQHIGRLAGSLQLALQVVAAHPLEEVWHDPVKDRAHLKSLLRYQLSQTFRHGVPCPPALWTGSSFLDVIGARVVDGLRLRLFEALPRLVAEDLLPMVGLVAGAIRAASDATVRALGAERLKRAAAAAFAVDPELRGNDRPTVHARRVVVRLARTAEIAVSDVKWVLDCSRSGVSRMARHDLADDRWVEAVRKRLTLEETVRREIERDWCRRKIQECATIR